MIEILLAVALLGLLSAALVSGGAQLLGDAPKRVDDVFWRAVGAARKSALSSEAEVRLSFSFRDKVFRVEGRSGQQTFPVPEARDLSVDFLEAQSGGGLVLVGGQLLDTQNLSAVTFFPDGTCSPFRVQFRTTGPARLIGIDPWTCAPVLEEKKP